MKKNNYWDVDDFLAEEEEVSIITSVEIRGLGSLDPNEKSVNLKENRRVGIPLWLSILLWERDLVEVEVPNYLKDSYIAAVEADPTIVNLKDRSPYYFQVADTLSKYAEDTRKLTRILVEIFILRIQFLINYLQTKKNSNILRKLTETEINIFKDCRRSTQEFRDWKQRKFERLHIPMFLAKNHKRHKLSVQ